jgi:hypothetical protein
MGSPEKKKLYVGCGLTFAPESFRENVEELKDKLSEDWEIMQFLGLGPAGPGDVYRKDIIENVGGCDAFLGVLDEPATMLGVELREAWLLNKPTLGVADVSSRVSRGILDAPIFNPTMRFRQYEDLIEDVPRIVLEEFEVIAGAVRLRNRS